MKGGTVARAEQAGFTPQQATFFAHMCMDTKDEAEERVVKSLNGIIAKKMEITLISHRMVAGTIGYLLGFLSCVVMFAVISQ